MKLNVFALIKRPCIFVILNKFRLLRNLHVLRYINNNTNTCLFAKNNKPVCQHEQQIDQ